MLKSYKFIILVSFHLGYFKSLTLFLKPQQENKNLRKATISYYNLLNRLMEIRYRYSFKYWVSESRGRLRNWDVARVSKNKRCGVEPLSIAINQYSDRPNQYSNQNI